MKYNIQKVIERLQKFQKENPDEKLIGEDELLSILTADVKYLDEFIDKLTNIDGLIHQFGNIDETAKILNVTRSTIHNWINTGIIEKKIGRIRLHDLLMNLRTLQKRREMYKV